MFVILLITSTIISTSALRPASKVEFADNKIKNIINKYIANISDIDDQYIVDERISRAISHYFNQKISAFPLFKISLKIDRTPVKIPWTLGDEPPQPEQAKQMQTKKQNKTRVVKHYKLKKQVKPNQIAKLSEKPVENKNIVTANITEKRGDNKDLGTSTEKPGGNKDIVTTITEKRGENKDASTSTEKPGGNKDIVTAVTEKQGENKVTGTSTEKPGGNKVMRANNSSGKPEKVEVIKPTNSSVTTAAPTINTTL